MISQIGPLVQAGKGYQIVEAHVLGGALGGLTAGTSFGLLGVLLHEVLAWPRSIVVPVLGLVLLGAFAGDSGLLRPLRIGTKRQTPLSWTCVFGNGLGVFAWGFDLGTGYTTKLTSYATIALPLYAILSANLVWSCLVFTAFGLTRATVSGWLSLRYGAGANDAAYCLGERQHLLFRASALGSLVAVASLVGVLL